MKKLMLKLAGKPDFCLDKNIGFLYLAAVCLKYAMMMMRGKRESLFSSNISKRFFVGKKVCIKNKSKLTVAENVKLHDGVKIDALSTEGVVLGKNVVLGENTRVECTGSLSFVGKGLRIGNYSSFGYECFFGAVGGITIGDDVVGGQLIRFHSENHLFSKDTQLIREQGVSHKGIKVGNNCWIGAGVVFLDGAEIGDGCVVGANSVVTKKFGSNVVLAGIPAKIIGSRVRE